MSLASFFIGILMVGIGGVLAYVFYQKYLFKQQSQDWPSVTATIVESHVSKKKNDEYESFCEIQLLYEYEVGGNVVRNSGMRRENYGKGSKRKDLKQKYAAGNTVLVYYNPENPLESVFHAGVGQSDLIVFIIPAIFILIGFSLM